MKTSDLICFVRAIYAGTALAFRDRLVIQWNKTQQNQAFADQKRVYCEWDFSRLKSLLTEHRSFPRISDGTGFGQCNAQCWLEERCQRYAPPNTSIHASWDLTVSQRVCKISVSVWKMSLSKSAMPPSETEVSAVLLPASLTVWHHSTTLHGATASATDMESSNKRSLTDTRSKSQSEFCLESLSNACLTITAVTGSISILGSFPDMT